MCLVLHHCGIKHKVSDCPREPVKSSFPQEADRVQMHRASSSSVAQARLSSLESRRWLKQRREILSVQALSYVAGALILLLYVHAGAIPITLPVAFVLSGTGLTAIFAVLSEMKIGDRSNDHFLTFYQAATNSAMQLAFLVVAPEIGIVFLSVIFVIFASAGLRMTAREAATLWVLTGGCVATILFVLKTTIAVPLTTPAEWLAGTSLFVTTIGQCAYFGVIGNSVNRKLHQRTVELKAAYQQIEELAQLDELTGVRNRRNILKCLSEEIARVQRTKASCSLAIIDLDFFKKINDQFGHPAGDEALRTFAIAIFANIRAIDRLGRYGGEEFLLVLPDTAQDEAVRMLDRLRSIISEVDWSAISEDLRLTMSAGICSIRPTDSTDEILSRADAALYQAKDAGRNCVVAT